MPTKKPQIEESWYKVLKTEFEQPYFTEIKQFLLAEKTAGKTVFPPGPMIFNAFNKTPLDKVKVVILGQDPYHGPGQAHGLCFSVQDGVRVPPSLRNVYKELHTDVGMEIPKSGNLETWADQGVFLLNAMLTVGASKAASHQKIGWQNFTDAAIRAISTHREGVVFMLWGNFAKKKMKLIDSSKHFILTSGHPSPLSSRFFFGCKHFSKANAFLEEQGRTPVNWASVPLGG